MKHAAYYRLLGALAAVGATTIIGGAGVVAAYYPLRHSGFALQWLLIFALMVGESAAIHLPSEVILPLGGWLVVRDHGLGVSGVLALSAIGAAGNTLGSGLLYVAGRRGGRPLVRRYGRWVLVHEREIDAAERRMRDHRVIALFISRLLPVVRTYAGFVAGILDIPRLAFVVTTFAGSFVWCLVFVAAGASLGSHWSAVQAPAEIAGVVIVALLLFGLAGATYFEIRKPRG